MKEQEIEQIRNILTNIENSQKKIPYLSDLKKHTVFWPIFSSLSQKEETEVENVIADYINEKIELIKKEYTEKDFQSLWKQVETEMFRLEGILTEKMLKQEKGLDKVIDSFYNIVYLFFPKFNEIE